MGGGGLSGRVRRFEEKGKYEREGRGRKLHQKQGKKTENHIILSRKNMYIYNKYIQLLKIKIFANI